MKEEYFKEVISKISDLCYEIREKKYSNNNVKFESLISNQSELKEYIYNRKELVEYLNSLTDTTLNVICALMDFGRRYNYKVLPINLNKFFNEYYLKYWFKKNETEDKYKTVNYLVSKISLLPEYLNRAKFILFDSKHCNIDFVHECGGSLCLEESDGVDEVEYDTYELHLMCLKCNGKVSKFVNEDFFDREI